MERYVLKRLLQAVFSLFAMSLFIFLLVRETGDPRQVLLPPDATSADYRFLDRELGLGRPLPEQYVDWVGKLVRGNFGYSAARHVTVAKLLRERLPVTLELAFAGFIVTLLIGIPLGIYAAAWKGSPLDAGARVFAVVGQSMPIFWLGIILIMIFSVNFHLLPAGGRTGGIKAIILPAVTMGWFTAAGVLRVTRSSMLEVLNSEYIKLARIKGASETAVLWKHAFKNASLPVLTYASLIFFTFVTGTIVTETVFAWPGVGTLVVQAVTNRDFNVVQVVVLLIAAIYLFGNVAVDVLYAYLNPRIRYA